MTAFLNFTYGNLSNLGEIGMLAVVAGIVAAIIATKILLSTTDDNGLVTQSDSIPGLQGER